MDASNVVLTGWIVQLQLQDCVILLGPRTDIPAVMNGLDLHVMSPSFGEAFPNVLAEAMACGVPCASTYVGDASQILGDTGQVVAPTDSAALAGAIGPMLAELGNPAHSARKIAARSRVADHFSVQSMVDSYRAAWFDAANQQDGLQ